MFFFNFNNSINTNILAFLIDHYGMLFFGFVLSPFFIKSLNTSISKFMRIIFAIKTMLVSGGAERVLSEVASQLINFDYEVSVLSFDKKKLPFYEIDKNIAQIKIGDQLPNKNILFLQFIKKIFSLRKEIKSNKPDVVIGFNYSMYFLLAISLIGLKVKLICSEHSSYESFKKKPLALFFLKILSFFKVRFFFVSHFAFNSFPKIFKRYPKLLSQFH